MNDHAPGGWSSPGREALPTVIGFVIPVLNGEATIDRCLDHVLREKGPGDRVVVVDNGSSDRTLSIVGEYPDVIVAVRPDLTIAGLRNHGATIAGGDLLAFIDSDCVLCVNWRQSALEVLADDVVMATGSRYALPETTCWIERAWYCQRDRGRRRVSYINSGNLIVRRRAFERVGGFDEALITDEDCDLGERLNASGAVLIDDPQVGAIHLGNPKTLVEFYRRQRWRATSALAGQTLFRPDRPTVMTVVFVAAAATTLLAIIASLIATPVPGLMLIPVPCVLIVTVLYRVVQYRRVRHAGQLLVLHLLYYSARAAALFSSVIGARPATGVIRRPWHLDRVSVHRHTASCARSQLPVLGDGSLPSQGDPGQ